MERVVKAKTVHTLTVVDGLDADSIPLVEDHRFLTWCAPSERALVYSWAEQFKHQGVPHAIVRRDDGLLSLYKHWIEKGRLCGLETLCVLERRSK